MKKKALALFLAASCTLTMAGCGNGEVEATETNVVQNEEEEPEESASEEVEEEEPVSEEPEEEAEEEKPEPVKREAAGAPADLSDNLYDFQVSIDGVVYQFPMWYSDFEALGWEYDGDSTDTLSSNQYTNAEVWEKDGARVYTRIANLSMNTATFAESMVAGITLEEYYLKDVDWEIILPGGIQYGVSNAEDIKAAYGEPASDYDGDSWYKMTYEYDSYQDIELYVYKDDNTLKEIEIRNIVELEGADNSVDPTVPDMVKEYKLPSSLGDDFYAYTAQLEGVVYSLPCPVSVLLENGFEINENNSDKEVAAGRNGWVELRYNNQKMRVMAKNFADYATTIENCFAISMEAGVYGPEFDLVLPGGIKVGSSEDDVKKAVADFNCDVDESDNGYTYYSVYDPDGSVLDNYDIIVKDGSVTSVEVQNSAAPK